MAEITITIKKRKKTPNSGTGKPKANSISRVRGAKKPLKRRLKKQGGIQFYDLGQILAGAAFVNVAFQVVPPFINAGNAVEVRDRNSEDYEQRDDLILGLDRTASRRIERIHGEKFGGMVYADNFSLTLNSENTDWTDGGLQLTSEQLSDENFTIRFDNQFFEKIVLTGEGKNKITALPDSSADEVPFVPGALDKYYLVPTIALSRLVDSGGPYAPGEYPRTLFQLNLFYLFAPRVAFMQSAEMYYQIDHAALPDARLMRTTENPETFFTFDSLSPGEFPDGALSGLEGFNAPSSYLVGIIQQGNNFFYAWDN